MSTTPSDYLREALAVVDARRKLFLTWSEQHPNSARFWLICRNQGIDRADEFAERYDKDDQRMRKSSIANSGCRAMTSFVTLCSSLGKNWIRTH